MTTTPITTADRADLRERVASYHDLAELAAAHGMTALEGHALALAHKYQAELDALEHAYTVALINKYPVPTDPADATNCEACQ